MRHAIFSLVLSSIFAFQPARAAGERGGVKPRPLRLARANLEITVRVYDYAGLPQATLRNAQRATQFIFKQAGIGMIWFECPLKAEQLRERRGCGGPYGPNDFILRILPAAMEPIASVPKDTFGFAMPCPPGASPCVANVFSVRVREWAIDTQTAFSYVLSRIIAHELGHLLLPGRPHSPYGIMRGVWGREDLDPHTPQYLVFTDEEKGNMRAAVEMREAQRGGSTGSPTPEGQERTHQNPESVTVHVRFRGRILRSLSPGTWVRNRHQQAERTAECTLENGKS